MIERKPEITDSVFSLLQCEIIWERTTFVRLVSPEIFADKALSNSKTIFSDKLSIAIPCPEIFFRYSKTPCLSFLTKKLTVALTSVIDSGVAANLFETLFSSLLLYLGTKMYAPSFIGFISIVKILLLLTS